MKFYRKKNINDHRESAGVKILQKFANNKYNIDYSDQFIPKILVNIDKKKKVFKSIEIKRDTLKKVDCIIIAADHDYFNYKMIANSCKIIFDTRGRFKNKLDKKIFQL